MNRPPQILSSSSSLLGIALVIVTGLKVTGKSTETLADEVALGAAVALAVSCLLSYLAFRDDADTPRLERWADRCFLAGLGSLLAAVLLLSIQIA